MSIMNFIRKHLGRNLVLPSIVKPLLPKVEIAIAAIFKNEASYLKEWIEYHKLIGVERFYLYDNESTDNVMEVLQPYIDDGTVLYRYIKGKALQMKAYCDAIYYYKHETKWLAIIDIDEFIVPVEKDTLNEFLKEYEGYPAVGINWVVFDSNGHVTKPEGLVTENYKRAEAAPNLHIKSIVRPDRVFDLINPHFCYYIQKKLAVNENFEPISGAFTNTCSVNKIRINHYLVKSEEEYRKKCEKGFADSLNSRIFCKEWLNAKEHKIDNTIDKYLPKLKEAMKRR